LSFAPNPEAGCGLQDTPWTGDRGNFTPIAVLACGLAEPMHGDPADRLIVATASTRGVPLETGDKKLQAYRGVKTIW
jgi:predicted nucleic acid-binding protein